MLPRLQPESGPLLAYLNCLPPDLRKKTAAQLQAILTAPDAAILLEALEKAVVHRTFSIITDERALVARNAQAILVADLKRLATQDEDTYVSARPTKPVPQTRRRDG